MLLELLDSLNTLLWGRLLLPFMIGIGVFLTVRLDFPQIKKFSRSFRLTVGKLFSTDRNKNRNVLSVWETASTALASTIGTGSIVGIAVAIKAGGPGTLFWMWVSAFFGMAIKYSEIVLAMLYRERSVGVFFWGGPMLYLLKGLGSRFLAAFFAVACLLVSFCMGNSVQANAIATVLKNQYEISPMFTGFVLSIVVGIVVLGGVKRVASINAKIVPFMSLLYIGCCVTVLILNMSSLPRILKSVFQEAFSFSSFFGGTSAYGFYVAIKNGFAKGVFSNEAGLGSAPIAHASSDSSDFEEQGAWGIFEVFFTTIIICTLTGFVILSTDLWWREDINAVALTNRAFGKVFSGFGSSIVSLSTVLFSLSTVLGWAFYGEICLHFLFPRFKLLSVAYRVLYVIVVFLGAVIQLDLVWSISELMNGLMAIPNLIGIVLLSGKIQAVSKKRSTSF